MDALWSEVLQTYSLYLGLLLAFSQQGRQLLVLTRVQQYLPDSLLVGGSIGAAYLTLARIIGGPHLDIDLLVASYLAFCFSLGVYCAPPSLPSPLLVIL